LASLAQMGMEGQRQKGKGKEGSRLAQEEKRAREEG